MAWPDSRPVDYDPDAFWDEDAQTWTGVDSGGSRHKTHLVVVGEGSDGVGVIYFGAV